MTKRNISASRSLDWVSISLYISLLIIGWLMLYATVYSDADPVQVFDLSTLMGKQSLWVLISLFVFVCSIFIDWKFWSTFAYPIYFVAIIFLVLVLFVGIEIKGARSWFSFGGLTFQPAEFAKFGCALALASMLSFHKSDLTKRNTILSATTIILIPAILILFQPDAGSAIVFCSFLILLFREGLSPGFYLIGGLFAAVLIFSLMFNSKQVLLGLLSIGFLIELYNLPKKLYWLLGGVAITVAAWVLYARGSQVEVLASLSALIVVLAIYLWWKKQARWSLLLVPSILFFSAISFGTSYAFDHFLEPHQKDRINVWLKPQECDPRGSLYNIIQSKLAIGSGGIAGKGFLQGDLTKLNYVPEQTTDFIFSTVGEEQGFIGSAAVIIIFILLIFRIVLIAERANNKFIRHYAYGLGGLIFIHFFINIGMTMGLMPVIGIPLPFLSKGGSALLVFSLMLGILIRMDLSRFRELSR